MTGSGEFDHKAAVYLMVSCNTASGFRLMDGYHLIIHSYGKSSRLKLSYTRLNTALI
jgi:hypothetical protein